MTSKLSIDDIFFTLLGGFLVAIPAYITLSLFKEYLFFGIVMGCILSIFSYEFTRGNRNWEELLAWIVGVATGLIIFVVKFGLIEIP